MWRLTFCNRKHYNSDENGEMYRPVLEFRNIMGWGAKIKFFKYLNLACQIGLYHATFLQNRYS